MAELQDYSGTAASNNSASPNGWPEGMAPSGLNDSDRELAARIARERDDTQGVTATGGSANAYTFAAARGTTAAYTGEMFVFRANHTNTGAATINITPSGGSARGAVAIQKDGSALVGGEVVSGGVYIIVYDGTQYQLANAAAFPATGQQNLIVNPEFRYDQEGYSGTTGVGGANDYISDQWEIIWDGTIGSRYTISQEADGGVSGSRKWLKILCTTAAASPSTGQFQYVRQQLEAQVIRPSLLNSSQKVGAMRFSMDMFVHADNASSITFPAQVGVFVITQDGTARQFVENVTITSADTWQRVTLEVDADTVATIDNNNGAGLTIGFNLVAEADRQTTGGAWENSGNDTHQSGAINIADATNNYIGITAVKLEPGTVATPFVSEDERIGLSRCRWFFAPLNYNSASGEDIANGYAVDATNARITLPIPLMRTAPSVTLTAGGTFTIAFHDGSSNCSSITAGGVGRNAIRLDPVVASGLTASEGLRLIRDGTDTCTVTLSARF